MRVFNYNEEHHFPLIESWLKGRDMEVPPMAWVPATGFGIEDEDGQPILFLLLCYDPISRIIHVDLAAARPDATLGLTRQAWAAGYNAIRLFGLRQGVHAIYVQALNRKALNMELTKTGLSHVHTCDLYIDALITDMERNQN